MDTSPLVMDEIEAGTEFLKRLHVYATVMGACWLREDEDEERYLFVTIKGLTVENSGVAYREVHRITQEMKDHYIDPFRVKLIGEDHPISTAIMDIYQRYPGRIPTRVGSRSFAGTSVAEIYIYPEITN